MSFYNVRQDALERVIKLAKKDIVFSFAAWVFVTSVLLLTTDAFIAGAVAFFGSPVVVLNWLFYQRLKYIRDGK